MSLGNALARLDGKSELTADDARTLRQIVYGDDNKIAQAEAETLFKLNADAGSHSQEWRQFFVEAMVDYVVRQEEPSGYIDQANADWLVDQMRKAGHAREDEIEMLVHALEVAEESPPNLQNFVLESVKNIVLAKLKQNQGLDGRDVERLRRVIYSKGGDGSIAVTRREAECLFDINDVLNGADADPAWVELFKRAVANAVLFESTWHPDRKAAQRREAWLADTSIHPLHFISGVASPGARRAMSEEARDLVHLDFQDRSLDRAYAAQEAVKADAERLTEDETHWLLERLRRNGIHDRNERAVVGFIRDNAQASGSQIETLISGLDRLAPAATQR